jgi:hypothetical protein
VLLIQDTLTANQSKKTHTDKGTVNVISEQLAQSPILSCSCHACDGWLNWGTAGPAGHLCSTHY